MKKSSAKFSSALIAIILGGCVAPSYIPPVESEKETSRQFNHPYQAVWDAVLDILTESGFKLDQVSKDSGYISVAQKLRVDGTEVDCGLFKPGDSLEVYTDAASANVAIRFKELPNDRSKVNVIVTAERTITGTDPWAGTIYNNNFPCESTGELERLLLDYVEDRAG